MSTGDTWRLGHRPALDGIRGIAIALVLVCHLFARDRLGLGSAGVTLFFTLSGFLITALLLEEHGRTGRVSLGRFWQRRAARLLPGLVVMVGVVTVTLVAAGRVGALRDVPPILFYYANWASMTDRLAPMQHTWSLAVEEQFYLAWPLILLVAMRVGGRRAVLWVAVIGAVLSAVARVLILVDGGDAVRVYLGTDTRADALLWGCALAAVLVGSHAGGSVPSWLPWAGIGLLAAVGFQLSDPMIYLGTPTVGAILAAGVVAVGAVTSSRGLLACRPLALLGKRSYGIYLWHEPIYYAVLELHLPTVATAAIVLVLTAGAVWLSWRYVEQPFLSKRLATSVTTACPARSSVPASRSLLA